MDIETQREDMDYTLRSRIMVFEEEVERLRCLMYGEEILVWPYMTDAEGTYSEENTMQLVERIVVKKSYGTRNRQEEAGLSAFYRKTLYCVLRVLTSGFTVYVGGSRLGYGLPEEICFSHILSAFSGHEQEVLDGNILFVMEMLYEIMAGKTISLDALGRKETETVIRENDEEEAVQYEAIEEALAEAYGYDIREIRNEEYRNVEETKHQAEMEREKVLRFFPEKEKFCQSVEEAVSFAEKTRISGKRMLADIRELIRAFLLDSETSAFTDEEAYVEVMIRLKRTVREAQKYTGERE